MNKKIKGNKGNLALSFYNPDGFTSTWKQASKFAGKGGRICTLPDIINARIHTRPGSIPWENYFVTLSAEYFGLSKDGKRILIVAHGIGPMATLDGIVGAYSYEFQDETRRNRGGRISIDEFRKLESGFYGPVTIVDFDKILKRYQYPFSEQLTVSQALQEELLSARFGEKAKEYIELHGKFATEYHQINYHGVIDNPHILKMGDANNCSYLFQSINKDDMPLAHLLSIGSLANVHHQGSSVPSLGCDVSCFEWLNGVRLSATQSGTLIVDINQGIEDVGTLLRENWKSLMRPNKPLGIGMRPLMKIKDNWFVQYSKSGNRMDTGEPEFLVTKIEKNGDLIDFVTLISGYHGFFKYGIQEVEKIAPPIANAYLIVGDPQILNSQYHHAVIQFYNVQVDTSKRIMRKRELQKKYHLLMKLTGK